jgi:protein disulfide-isomerase
MKKLIIWLAVMGLGFTTFGAEGWLTDFEAAKKIAAEKGVPILADFSGSDWCGWCIKLDKEVFSQDEFKAYAKDNLVLFLADFPRSTPQTKDISEQNSALAEKYGVRGFPTVLILNAGGEVLERTGYQRGGAEKYIEHLKELLK